MILGLNGRARSGKDTVAQSLISRYEQVERIAFADKLKQSAAAALGISVERLEELKTDERQWSLDGEHGFTTRQFLQRYGSEAHRATFSDLFWIEEAFRGLVDEPERITVVSDCRFENEAKAIHARGGVVVRIRRAEAELVPVTHASEADISSEVDYEIQNDGTLEDLDQAVDAMLLWVFHNFGFPLPYRKQS